eukprot:3502329-Rhodomonas_salina.1
MASRANFQFSLALKSKDSADAVLTMAAAKLDSIVVAYGRQKDVLLCTISNDRIFEQVAYSLCQGGSMGKSVSLEQVRQLVSPAASSNPLRMLQHSSNVQKCKKGHALRWETLPYREGMTCNLCKTVQKCKSHPNAWRCGTCQFDLCCKCRGPPTCGKGHGLTWPVSYTHLTLPTICSV